MSPRRCTPCTFLLVPFIHRFTLSVATCSFLLASPALSQEKSVPVFANGEAQIVPGFKEAKNWIRQDLWVETEFDSDGDGKMDRVHVDVTRPKQTETEGLKLPIIYESSPYFAGTGSNDKKHFWNPAHELGAVPPKHENPPPVKAKNNRPIISDSQTRKWIPRGYIVVHSSSPGTGLSQGCPTVGGDNESLAPKAVIDWLCGRAQGFKEIDGEETVKAFWSSGKVGMTGTSYNGTIPLAAATTGVEGLEAIIPVAPNTSYYHYYRSNGLVRHPGGYMGEDIDVLYDFIHSGNEARREHCDCEVRDKEMANNQDRVTGDYNSFWAGRDYLNDMGPMRAALLMSHGFNDWNVVPEHSVRIYEAAKAKGIPVQFYCHQAGHGGDPPMNLMNRWFTKYLHGVDNGVEKDPRSWIVRENAKQSQPTSYADYPNPEAKPVTLHLTKGGTTHGGLTTSPSTEPQRETLVDNAAFFGRDLAQAATSKHRLLFETPKLKEALHISGFAKIKIRLASSKPAANLSVWLVSLPWTDDPKDKINDNLITRGWADPQNHSSESVSEPLIPNQFYDLTFSLQPDDQIIPAGESIGLMIFSSDPEFTLLPPAGTELTVELQGTELVLPIVGGQAAYDKATGK